jgi:hypothetical protein
MTLETQSSTAVPLWARALVLVGVPVRILAITAFLTMGYAALGFGAGEPIWESPQALRLHATVAVPFLLVAAIAELQISMLRGVGFGPGVAQVLLPFAMALVGAYFGYLRFVAPLGLTGAVARMFLFGSALLFFLAASFHVWSWYVGRLGELNRTPMLWYAGLMCVAGAFFGSCIAAGAPSPYLKHILEYREQAWGPGRKASPLPLPDFEEDQTH